MEGERGFVIVVDDDQGILQALRRLLERAGYRVETYSSPLEFLSAGPPTSPGCLLLDVEMPGLNGLELQEALLRSDHPMSSVFVTGHGDVPRSVKAMKAGAVDVLLKPFANEEVLRAVAAAIERSERVVGERHALSGVRDRLARLTHREREVCDLVAEGLTSKEIAERLGTAEKTISVHRGRVMAKMQVRSVADLVRLCQADDAVRMLASEDAPGR